MVIFNMALHLFEISFTLQQQEITHKNVSGKTNFYLAVTRRVTDWCYCVTGILEQSVSQELSATTRSQWGNYLVSRATSGWFPGLPLGLTEKILKLDLFFFLNNIAEPGVSRHSHRLMLESIWFSVIQNCMCAMTGWQLYGGKISQKTVWQTPNIRKFKRKIAIANTQDLKLSGVFHLSISDLHEVHGHLQKPHPSITVQSKRSVWSISPQPHIHIVR